MARISIAMCTYFGERYLEQQLESLSQQTNPPFELVICDDGSTDATLSLLKEWQSRCPFTTRLFINKERLGYAANFQKALGECRGDWIAFCDQDDIWHPQKLARIHAICRPELGIIFHNAQITQNKGSSLLWDHCGLTRRLLQNRSGLANLLKINFAFGNTMVIRRKAIPPAAFPFFNSHDRWLAHAVALHHPVHFLEEPLIFYRQHESQIIPNRVKKLSFVEKLNQIKNSYKAIEDDLGFLEELIARTETHSLLTQKVDHLRQRIAFSQKQGLIQKALSDLIKGYYHKYSNGVQGFVKDMVMHFSLKNS